MSHVSRLLALAPALLDQMLLVGRQPGGWSFDFRHLYSKSGSLSRFSNFACDLRDIVHRQPLPGYRLRIDRRDDGRERLIFAPAASRPSIHSQGAVQKL